MLVNDFENFEQYFFAYVYEDKYHKGSWISKDGIVSSDEFIYGGKYDRCKYNSRREAIMFVKKYIKNVKIMS